MGTCLRNGELSGTPIALAMGHPLYHSDPLFLTLTLHYPLTALQDSCWSDIFWVIGQSTAPIVAVGPEAIADTHLPCLLIFLESPHLASISTIKVACLVDPDFHP